MHLEDFGCQPLVPYLSLRPLMGGYLVKLYCSVIKNVGKEKIPTYFLPKNSAKF